MDDKEHWWGNKYGERETPGVTKKSSALRAQVSPGIYP